MPADEPQRSAEQLDDEQAAAETEYGPADEAVDPPETPMAVDEPAPDTPDPYSLVDREDEPGWEPSDEEPHGGRWIDTSATAEDVEPDEIADEWREIDEPSAEEAAINEIEPPDSA